MARLFFALWPPGDVQRALAASVPAAVLARGRPVPAGRIHLPLPFAGPVNDQVQACLEKGADGLRIPPFELVLDRLGVFRRARVLWIGAEAPRPLTELAAGLRAAAAACGLQPEERPFVPHVTLARKIRPGLRLPRPEPVRWVVESFVLVASETLPGGAEYRILRRWPLVGD